MGARGVIIAAPASGSGKTLVTMGLLRCLRDRGVDVAPAKAGPDYIDAGFHSRAAGRDCVNLDSWAMRPATLARLIGHADLLLAEGVMGLFDGAVIGDRLDVGSTAELAALTGWPVVLVVNAHGQGASVGALLRGFAGLRGDVSVAGVIFNNVGSIRHADLLRRAALAAVPDAKPLGAVPRDPELHIESRHLGLKQARELATLEPMLARLSALIAEHVDLDGLLELARPAGGVGADEDVAPVPPLGQCIAVARDDAFSFVYPHVLDGWRTAGAELRFFSPLADEGPPSDVDAVYLPGGYPELSAGRLAANTGFLENLSDAAARGSFVYGECGGYMTLGHALTDGDGGTHKMAGLLPLETSFADPKLHLGYRQTLTLGDGPFRALGFRGHEFHYARTGVEGPASPLFQVRDAAGQELGNAGLHRGSVAGSFMHLIDRAGA